MQTSQGVLIQLNKCQGEQPLFGSSFQHQTFLSLKISKAKSYRSFNVTRYRSGEVLLEARLSFAQFAELITSFNQGEGIPATLKRLGKENFADPEIESETNLVLNEINQELQEALKNLDDSIATVNEQNISKKAKKAILDSLYASKNKLIDSIPATELFWAERVKEIESNIKIEIASYLALTLEKQGLNHLQGQQIFLPQQ